MKLEDLPNELFIEIFSYLNEIYFFLFLNRRFQQLIYQYCSILNLKSISKSQFDQLLDEETIEKCKSLQLSNSNETFGQIEYCLERYPLNIYFTRLQCLSLHKMRIINQSILYDLSLLTNLVSLKLGIVCSQIISIIDFSNLNKLKQLIVQSCLNTTWIQDLKRIQKDRDDPSLSEDSLSPLNFPQIENVDYTILNCCSHSIQFEWPLQLKHLKLVIKSTECIDLIPESLKNLTNLLNLKIYQKVNESSYPNGQIWQDLICSSFKFLKTFEYSFQFHFYSDDSNRIEEMIRSFSSDFYLKEKKWFSRCELFVDHSQAILYSLPNYYDRYTITTNSFDETILIYSNQIIQHRELSIIDLISNDYCHLIKRLYLSPIFSIRKISINKKNASKKFEILLKTLSQLYFLSIQINQLEILTNNWTNQSVCLPLSNKICSLKLSRDEYSSQWFDDISLREILRIFAFKCQHLSIRIPSPVDTLLSILREMNQLRSLKIPISMKNDESITMKWLEQQNCGLNYSNCHLINNQNNCYFWLGRD
ncbi:hypothetical protein I4U23_022638 [Adineta vaga]|nr:hypothetical protein I4U23_022638 [Adineta vaga]